MISPNGIKLRHYDTLLEVAYVDSFCLTEFIEKDIVLLEKYEKNGSSLRL